MENTEIKETTITDLHPLIQFLVKNYMRVSVKHQISVFYGILESNKLENVQ